MRASSDARFPARLHARSLEVTSSKSSSPPQQARPLTMQRGPARSGSACNAFACNARALHAMLRMQCSGSACNAFGSETGSSRRRPGRRHRSERALAQWGSSSVSSVWVCVAWVAPKGQGSDAHRTDLPCEACSRLAGALATALAMALATALATEFVRCIMRGVRWTRRLGRRGRRGLLTCAVPNYAQNTPPPTQLATWHGTLRKTFVRA